MSNGTVAFNWHIMIGFEVVFDSDYVKNGLISDWHNKAMIVTKYHNDLDI